MKLLNNVSRAMFRQYDVRGIYGSDLSEDVAYTIGRAYGSYIKKTGCSVIGHDNRVSSPVLVNALIKGINESGVDVYDIGLVTTPMFYFARLHFKLPGIMVTASHNPSEYNGFKISFDYSGNAYGDAIQEFYDYMSELNFVSGEGSVSNKDIKELYIDEIERSIKLGNRKIKCLVDLGNGTASVVVKDVMKRLGIICTVINEKKDLSVPSEYLDPSVKDKMVQLSREVVRRNYDIGIGVDGDADRVGIVDEMGNILSTDEYMIIMYRYLNECLKNRKALFDVKCSRALIDELRKLDIEPVMYRTGNSYMGMMMKKGDFDFGGEFSGHVWFRDRWLGFDDGLYAGIRMLEILSNEEIPLSKMLKNINKYYATDEIKFKVREDNKFDIVNAIKEECIDKEYDIVDIDGVRINFDHYWILVRASNTGPNLTVRIEADDSKLLNSLEKRVTIGLNNFIDKWK